MQPVFVFFFLFDMQDLLDRSYSLVESRTYCMPIFSCRPLWSAQCAVCGVEVLAFFFLLASRLSPLPSLHFFPLSNEFGLSFRGVGPHHIGVRRSFGAGEGEHDFHTYSPTILRLFFPPHPKHDSVFRNWCRSVINLILCKWGPRVFLGIFPR